MRRLELTGELTAGRFFAGINSLQFASPRIIEELEALDKENHIYWMNAADPASPAGLGVSGLDPRLPARLATARLCFRGAELLAVSSRSGKVLDIFLSPEDPELGAALSFLSIPRTRAVHPQKKLVIESINGKTAALSEYAATLKQQGFLADRGKLILW
jgi:ATP-dependent Lhr-like helicase